mmetsp:Transcript_43626/g.89190  ORF Transcript_43626/g.89190 Transcript_43626/m.89190 type:complete len:122 (-) Transcript_43626:63-428(-)
MFNFSLQVRASFWLFCFICWAQTGCWTLKTYASTWGYGHHGMHMVDAWLMICKTQCVAWTYPEMFVAERFMPHWGRDTIELWYFGGVLKYAAVWLFIYIIALTVPDPPPVETRNNKTVKFE